MTKKISKSEKLDMLVREMGRMSKQLKLLNLKQNEIAENVAKLSRKGTEKKPAPAAATSPRANKKGADGKAKAKSGAANDGSHEGTESVVKLVSG